VWPSLADLLENGMSDASKLARDHDAEAIKVIKDIMDDPHAEHKDRLKAAEALLDRGHGKAAQAIIAVPASRKMITELAALSEEELYAVIQSEPLPRLGAPQAEKEIIDADFEDGIDPLLL
jgi:hypothetical protein